MKTHEGCSDVRPWYFIEMVVLSNWYVITFEAGVWAAS